jgi:hypothetical protein
MGIRKLYENMKNGNIRPNVEYIGVLIDQYQPNIQNIVKYSEQYWSDEKQEALNIMEKITGQRIIRGLVAGYEDNYDSPGWYHLYMVPPLEKLAETHFVQYLTINEYNNGPIITVKENGIAIVGNNRNSSLGISILIIQMMIIDEVRGYAYYNFSVNNYYEDRMLTKVAKSIGKIIPCIRFHKGGGIAHIYSKKRFRDEREDVCKFLYKNFTQFGEMLKKSLIHNINTEDLKIKTDKIRIVMGLHESIDSLGFKHYKTPYIYHCTDSGTNFLIENDDSFNGHLDDRFTNPRYTGINYEMAIFIKDKSEIVPGDTGVRVLYVTEDGDIFKGYTCDGVGVSTSKRLNNDVYIDKEREVLRYSDSAKEIEKLHDKEIISCNDTAKTLEQVVDDAVRSLLIETKGTTNDSFLDLVNLVEKRMNESTKKDIVIQAGFTGSQQDFNAINKEQDDDKFLYGEPIQ